MFLIIMLIACSLVIVFTNKNALLVPWIWITCTIPFDTDCNTAKRPKHDNKTMKYINWITSLTLHMNLMMMVMLPG